MMTQHRNLLARLHATLSARTPGRVAGALTPSAVAVLLLEHEAELCVIMTLRAKALRSYPGCYTLPGGRVDDSDASLEETALRETFEEIGVASHLITLLGRLDEQHTRSGYRLTPIVGVLWEPPIYRLSPNEVESLLLLPLSQIPGLSRDTSLAPLIPFKTREVLVQLSGLLAGA